MGRPTRPAQQFCVEGLSSPRGPTRLMPPSRTFGEEGSGWREISVWTCRGICQALPASPDRPGQNFRAARGEIPQRAAVSPPLPLLAHPSPPKFETTKTFQAIDVTCLPSYATWPPDVDLTCPIACTSKLEGGAGFFSAISVLLSGDSRGIRGI